MIELRGKTAVVTGAAGGIGAALARQLHAAGCRVALVDRAGDSVAALCGTLGGRSSAHAVDVADAGAWDALTKEIERAHGPADILVNNAGVTILGRFADQTLEDLDRIVDVNLKGVLYGCRAFLPQLTARGEGHIVNLSSLAGRVAFPYQSTYCATKFAVRGFTAALRMELASLGIGVTAVLPGTVATKLLATAQSYDPSASKRMAELMLAHGASPDRVAQRVILGMRRNEAEVLVGWDARLTTLAQSIAPRVMSRALGAGARWRSGS